MITPAARESMALSAHLLRRAGFGARYEELERYAAQGYQATVEEILHPEDQPPLEEDMAFRLNLGWLQIGSVGQDVTYGSTG